LHVDGGVDPVHAKLQLRFRNTGKAAAVFHVRAADGFSGPWTYTVGAQDDAADTFNAAGAYDASGHGPNGFFRRFAGRVSLQNVDLTVQAVYDGVSGGIALVVRNDGGHAVKVNIADAYSKRTITRSIQGHDTFTLSSDLNESFGGYDFLVTADSDSSFARQLAGTSKRARQHDRPGDRFGSGPPHRGRVTRPWRARALSARGRTHNL
jgi:phospholipase C